MRKSYSSRIKITKTGKVKRRKMGMGHFKTKQSATNKQSKRRQHDLGYSSKALAKRITN